jgi:hypothetical protein
MDQGSSWSEYHRGQARILVKLARSSRDPNTVASLMRLAARQEEMADRADRKAPLEALQPVPPIVKLYAGNRKVGRTPVS